MSIDTTRPHIGRIYDFVLGGHHNYEVDREAAAAILKVAPVYPKWARLNRWFLQFVANKWSEEGRKNVLDVASGLPTEGHFNDFMPDARILFSDNEPVSVAYGEEILKDRPNMRYVQADVGQPAALLQHASEFFGDARKIAVGCIGIAYLVPDETLRELARQLHAWSAPGSIIAMTFGAPVVAAGTSGNLQEITSAMLKFGGAQIWIRTPERIAELVAPWRMTACKPLPQWLDVPDIFTEEEITQTGGYMAGAFLER